MLSSSFFPSDYISIMEECASPHCQTLRKMVKLIYCNPCKAFFIQLFFYLEMRQNPVSRVEISSQLNPKLKGNWGNLRIIRSYAN